jgi:hypothetical protein
LRKSEGMRVRYHRAHIRENILGNRSWKKASHLTNDEIRDLKARVDFYRDEQVKYSWNNKLRVAEETDTQSRLEVYSKMACQRECRKFFAGPLPRELRDMVYEWIIGDSNVNLNSVLINQLRSNSSPTRWEDYTFDPWCWSEDFMGPDFLGEYLERWFAVTEFTINMNLNMIPDLIKCPRPTLSIDPAALISRVVVVLRQWSFQTFSKALLDDFHHLLKFRNQVHIELVIDAPDICSRKIDNGRIKNFVSSLDSIFPVLRQLKENGALIEVTIDDDCHIDSNNVELSHEGWVKRIKENRDVCA